MLLLASLVIGPATLKFTIDGVERTALVFAPSHTSVKPPVVFGFHGHGGNSRQASRSFRIQEEWPGAVVVYMQGLPTPSPKVDPEGKRPGWQNNQGQEGDRDLKFFDKVYASIIQEHKADHKKVYAMGHSNGGRFTYLLMQQRGGLFSAFGPSGSPAHLTGMPNKPVFHVAGEKDPLVSFRGQKASVELLKQQNKCGDGTSTGTYTTLYKAPGGNDIVTYFHPGGHEYPAAVPALLVRFFQSH